MIATHVGDRKGTQRTFATKISLNFRVNFLARFASKPLFYWVVTGSPIELFRQFFGTVRAIFGFGVLFGLLNMAIPRHKTGT